MRRFCATMRVGLFSMLLLGGAAAVRAQEPSLAPADLDFTREIAATYHWVAWVSLEMEENTYTNYQYDRYPDRPSAPGVERIKADEGVFARAKGKPWLRSDDWGDTGTPVAADLAQKLDLYANVADAQLAKPKDHDASQGAAVWKFIGQTKDKTFTYYTYERSREHPRPGGVYPHFTFMKAAPDTDGRLFLCRTTAQLRSGDRLIPVTVRMDYLIPLPPGTKVVVTDHVTGKKTDHTVTGKDSGWEITTPQSAPPPGP